PSSPPLTTRVPSQADARMAPSWIATRRSSPSGSANSSASSPSTNTAVRPRKCAPTTVPPAAIARVRSTTETVSLRASLISGDAALKTFGDRLARQVAADEDDAAVALLVLVPGPLVIAVQNHMHALKDETLVVALERENALAAQNVRPFLLHQLLDPRKELVGIERLVGFECNRLHVLVVIMLQAAVMMGIIVIVVMLMMMIVIVTMVVMMVVISAVAVQKSRLDFEDAVEIEGVAVQHFVERDLGALRLVQPGVRIDAANAGLDVAQFFGRDQVRLVEQDHIGKRDLVLGLGRVLEPVVEPLGVGDGNHGVELGAPADVLVHEKGLRHRRRIGQSRGLDDDGVELAFAAHQAVEDAHQVAAHGAADAAVVHLEHFLVGADHQIVVDADFAEFVDDHGVFLAVRLRQDAVEQCGLAGAEIARQHRDRNFVSHWDPPFAFYIDIRPALHPPCGCSGTRRLAGRPRLDRGGVWAIVSADTGAAGGHDA